MPDIVAKLKKGMGNEAADRALLEDALQEITQLRGRRDALEEILIILVRTGFPWDEEGAPTDSFPAFRERYQRVMHEASELLGLELRSTITRTEPRT
jgi:hypothetical protein